MNPFKYNEEYNDIIFFGRHLMIKSDTPKEEVINITHHLNTAYNKGIEKGRNQILQTIK